MTSLMPQHQHLQKYYYAQMHTMLVIFCSKDTFCLPLHSQMLRTNATIKELIISCNRLGEVSFRIILTSLYNSMFLISSPTPTPSLPSFSHALCPSLLPFLSLSLSVSICLSLTHSPSLSLPLPLICPPPSLYHSLEASIFKKGWRKTQHSQSLTCACVRLGRRVSMPLTRQSKTTWTEIVARLTSDHTSLFFIAHS